MRVQFLFNGYGGHYEILDSGPYDLDYVHDTVGKAKTPCTIGYGNSIFLLNNEAQLRAFLAGITLGRFLQDTHK